MNQIIPLDNSPNQTFQVPVNVVTATQPTGQVVILSVILRYNDEAGYWVMTFQDSSGNLLLDSIPLLPGENSAVNILGQYAYLQIGSAAVVNYSGTTKDHPDNTDLGTDFILVWGDTPLPV